jgi:hypothetical protein
MVMDRALAARDARRMRIAISARGSICDHARARGSHSALVQPRTEKHREKPRQNKKSTRSQTREQSRRARRKHKKVRQTAIARATVPNPVAI